MPNPTGCRTRRAKAPEDSESIERALKSSAFVKFCNCQKLNISRREACLFWGCSWPGEVEAVERMTSLLLGRERVELRELGACHDFLSSRFCMRAWA